ncbi:MAG: alpha/beta hydrolase, partial [Erysipelotrichales bacterium]
MVLIATQYEMPKSLLKLQNIVFRFIAERAFKGMVMGKKEGKKPAKMEVVKNFLDIVDHQTIAIGLDIEIVKRMRKNEALE